MTETELEPGRTQPEVVVVEDDDGLRRVETRELERAGFVVRVAESSDAAIEQGNEREPDCWLIDQGLSGGMSGVELAAALRESGHDAPIVLIAARDEPDVLVQALRGGVHDFVLKGPGFPELLVARVQATIDAVRRARADAEAQRSTRRTLEGELAERRRSEDVARAAIERLEEVDRRKDEFLAMLGHELRNPLAPISNAIEILRLRGGSSSEVQWAVEVVGRQVAQLRRLVDDLLDVSRITYGRFQLAFSPVLVKDVVLNAIERCRPAMEAKDQQLSLTQMNEQMAVYGDSTRLEQALVNLIDNAIERTAAHGHVVITTWSADSEAMIVIADNGRGIAADDLANVFQTMARDGDGMRKPGGLGVGLGFVRRVAELHGGRAEAASPGIDKGATFTLRLPLSRLAPAAPSGERPRPPIALAGRRVVVVDDDVDSAESMAMLLRLWGFTVDCVHDGAAAIELVAAAKPAAVLLDLGMPGLDGLRVAERLRALPGLEDLLLVAVTGHAQQRDREQTRRAGFDRHLVKPVAAASLQETLGRLLQA